MQDGTHVYVVGVVVEVYQLPLANLELGHEVVVAVLGHPLRSILQTAASLGAAHQVQDLFDVWVEGEELVFPQGVELGKALQLNQYPRVEPEHQVGGTELEVVGLQINPAGVVRKNPQNR